jgi:hypothetical protein
VEHSTNPASHLAGHGGFLVFFEQAGQGISLVTRLTGSVMVVKPPQIGQVPRFCHWQFTLSMT